MLKIVFPYFDDNNLDRWMKQTVSSAEAGAVGQQQSELVLAEALQKFHIASCQSSR
jgi:hypothetical protein